MPWYRVCPRHLVEVTETTTASDREIIWCPEGHACRKTIVVDEKGNVVWPEPQANEMEPLND